MNEDLEGAMSSKPGASALSIPINDQEPVAFTAEEIEALLLEDSELYDITMIFNNDILVQDLKATPNKKKLVSKIVQAFDKSVKVYCDCSIDSENQIFIIISGICEDSKVKIFEDKLNVEVIKGLLKVTFARGCVPYHMPIRLIKTIEDFCQICIFPFLTFQNENFAS